MTSQTSASDDDMSLEEHRAAAEHSLEAARRNPILSGEQACAIAQVHALLAIERRLAQMFAVIVAPNGPGVPPGAALAQ
jgi:hypothetical protein